LLDIHVDAGASPPLEIFEAGTGHGSLTLALARAVHAGNSHLPRPPTDETKAQRGAIIHTLDKSSRHSQQARDVVRGFRRGMYKDNVEFYVGDPSEWIHAQLEKRGIAAKEGNLGQGFLYAVVLDLPGPEEHLKAAADALINDGIVCVFCPSITQIGACVSAVRQLELPLVLDKVLEFPGGAGTGAGLRAWDVRFAHVRSRAARPLSVAEAESPAETEAESTENKYEMVCRPTSFENFVGGGFFGMFRRKARGGEGAGTAKNLVAVAERAAAAAKATEEKIAAKIAAKAAAEEAAGKAAEETGEETVAEERIEEGAVEQAGIDTHDTHQK
jgi:tRNA (adenine57-N1/adenine58-N1)-methyltransferase